MSLVAEIVLSLKAVANVPVYTNSRPIAYEDSTMNRTIKLAEFESRYTDIYQFASTAWRNLPQLPEYENAFVIAWSVINRIRTVFDTRTKL